MKIFAIIIIVVLIMFTYISILKMIYKITYYETRLELRGIDISDVKNKSLYRMFRD